MATWDNATQSSAPSYTNGTQADAPTWDFVESTGGGETWARMLETWANELSTWGEITVPTWTVVTQN